MLDLGVPEPAADPIVRPTGPARSPGDWVKKNLFNSPLNSVITVVLTPLLVYLGYRLFRFVFITGQWEPVRVNMELLMVAQYPRAERWRLIAQLVMMAGAIGMAIGLIGNRAEATAAETGMPRPPRSWRTYAASYWSIALFVVVVLLAFSRTAGPYLITAGSLVAAGIGYAITRKLPVVVLPYAWTLAALVAVVSFQMVSGTGGWAWAFTTLALIPAATAITRSMPAALRWPVVAAGVAVGVTTLVLKGFSSYVGWAAVAVGVYTVVTALRGDRIDASRTGLLMCGGGLAFLVDDAVGLSGVDWENWGGLHLTLVVSATATILALPLGILLALGRRSKLPAVKFLSVAYIEFFRGAPLISFLLASAFFFSFFIGADTGLSTMTKAIAAITMFSAAYIAEVVRGGLNAVSKGQVEAGQALGLPPGKVNRLIVLPQALRAVIPAMVGQFISLLKDTSLLYIIGISEWLGARALIHSQNEFRGLATAETLVFAAFGYWAFTFAMSRESQRLERRLGVGHR